MMMMMLMLMRELVLGGSC